MAAGDPTPHTYGLLGMLAVRPWTGYELVRQVRRSLRFVWSTSEGHLYREQKRLVSLGWAVVTTEQVGRRTRQSYAITEAGRAALRAWLATPPADPSFQIEGVLRAHFGDQGTPADLAASLSATALAARGMLEEMLGFVEEYLADGGPVALLEQGRGGPGERVQHAGRTMYPERLHAVALSIDAATRMLEAVDRFASAQAEEVAAWPGTTDPALTSATRQRLEAVLRRGRTWLDDRGR